MGRARETENSIVFDGNSDADHMRKSMGALLKQSIRLDDRMVDGMFDIPQSDMMESKVFDDEP